MKIVTPSPDGGRLGIQDTRGECKLIHFGVELPTTAEIHFVCDLEPTSPLASPLRRVGGGVIVIFESKDGNVYAQEGCWMVPKGARVLSVYLHWLREMVDCTGALVPHSLRAAANRQLVEKMWQAFYDLTRIEQQAA